METYFISFLGVETHVRMELVFGTSDGMNVQSGWHLPMKPMPWLDCCYCLREWYSIVCVTALSTCVHVMKLSVGRNFGPRH